MQYLSLAYTLENRAVAISPSERAIFEHACQSNDGILCASGHLLATLQLLGPGDRSAGVTIIGDGESEIVRIMGSADREMHDHP